MSNAENHDQDIGDQVEEFDTDLGFDDVPGAGGAKNNPLIKIGAVAVGFVVILAAIFYLGGSGSENKTPPSEVGEVPTEQNIGGEPKEVTPEYKQAIMDYNQQKVEEAKKTGESYMAISTNSSQQNLENTAAATQEDPAEKFRQVQEEYARQQEAERAKQANEMAAAEAAARQQRIDDMARAMSSYLTSIASTRTPKGMMDADAGFSSGAPVSGANGAGMAASTAGSGMYGAATASPNAMQMAAAQQQVAPPKILIPAAKIEYGQLLIEANTDAPGPVLALLGSGKLSGSRLIGSFQKTDKFLTLRFTQLVTKAGETLPIQAIALDPGTTLPGMVTEIDHRYFERYIIPAAAEFVSGVGQALAQTATSTTQTSSSTTTSSNDPDFSEAIAQGTTEAFNGIGEALRNEASRVQPMLRIAPGTPIGVFFTQAVNDPNTVSAAWQQQQYQQQLQQYQQRQMQMGMSPYMTQMGAYGYGQNPYGYGMQQQAPGGFSLSNAMVNAVGNAVPGMVGSMVGGLTGQ